MNPLDLERLAYRIENLQRQSVHGWRNGDDLEFRNHLPNGRAQNKLPDPQALRTLAGSLRDTDNIDVAIAKMDAIKNWRIWMSVCMRLESMIVDNNPRNPKRMMQDMIRGKFPGMR